MKREIKFRVWTSSGVGFKMFGNEEALRLLYNNSAESKLLHRENIGIMQYTGLKDKNGVEIYEGDILKATPGEKSPRILIGEIKYNEMAMFAFCYDGRYNNIAALAKYHELEVIGNIYENPELL